MARTPGRVDDLLHRVQELGDQDTREALRVAALAVEEAGRGWEEHPDRESRRLLARTRIAEAGCRERLGQFDEAMASAHDILDTLVRSDDADMEARALRVVAECHAFRDSHEQARHFMERALEASERAGDPHSHWKLLLSLGMIQFQARDLPAAIATYTRTGELCREIGEPEGEAKALMNTGAGYSELGRFEQALDHYRPGLRLAREIGNVRAEAFCLFNIAAAQLKLGSYDDVSRFGREALLCARRLGDQDLESSIFHAIGEGEWKRGNLQAALALTRQALRLRRKLGGPIAEAVILDALGEMSRSGDDPDQAMTHYARMLELVPGDERADLRLRAHMGLAAALVQRGDPEPAVTHIEQAQALVASAHDPEVVAALEKTAADVYTAGGDHERALDHHRRYTEITVARLEERAESRLRDLQVLHQLEHARHREDALERDNRELEDRVHRRTKALAAMNEQLEREVRERRQADEERDRLQDHLRQAQKLEALGVFAGGVAHDFNNLLTVITGYAEQLRRQSSEHDTIGHAARQVLAASERGATLTRQLLAFSRKRPISVHPVKPDEVVRGLEDLLSRLIGDDVTIEIRATSVSPVLGDRGQLEQVLTNLTTNARDAMPEGGRLIIETADIALAAATPAHPDLSPGSYVCIRVTDTGTGIDPAIRDHIFEPFFTTKDPGRGTGLGLSTVHGIVSQLNGSLEVRSEAGKGAEFEILLPVTADGPAPEEDPAGDAVPAGTRVLVVEDNHDLRRLLCQDLTSTGYSVLEAEDGLHATEVFAAEPSIDLLVTDVVMPKLGGAELLQMLRKQRPELPAVVITGHADRVAMFQEMPGVELLHKPFSLAVLHQALHRVLGDRS